jgi:hypothetical protein
VGDLVPCWINKGYSVGQTNITTLNDIVDTLKLQFYPTDRTTLEEINNFNLTIEKLVLIKAQAMEIKNHDSQKRFIKSQISDVTFKVMAVAQSSFNVVLQNADVSISLLKISPAHNNPVIKAEFRAEFLLRNGYNKAIALVKDIINNLLQNYKVKVSEIHLAKDIQGYEFSMFDLHRIKTLSKIKTVFHNDINSEYYFGNRFSGFSIGKGDELLRVYNKTLEIALKKEKSFISVLSWQNNPNFNPKKNVWRMEFQLRRERLKYLLGNNGLLDSLDNVLSSIHNLWTYCITRFVHKNLSTQQLVEQIQCFKINKDGTFKYLDSETLRKRFQRAEISHLWDSIKTFEKVQAPTLQRIKDIKKPEVEYVKNAYKSILSTFVKLKRGAFNSEDLTKILLEADNECKIKHGMNLVDKARVNALDYIVQAQTFYNDNGIVIDGFYEYKKDFVNNLKDTFALIENDNSNLFTFEQFQKRIMNVK